MVSLDLDVLAGRLKNARNARNLTQAQLAEAAGVTDETISRLERAAYEPSLSTTVQIANALGLSLDMLVGRGAAGSVELLPASARPMSPRVAKLANKAVRLSPTAQRALLLVARLLRGAPSTGAEDDDDELGETGQEIYRLLKRATPRGAEPGARYGGKDDKATANLASLLEDLATGRKEDPARLRARVRQQLGVRFDTEKAEALTDKIVALLVAGRKGRKAAPAADDADEDDDE